MLIFQDNTLFPLEIKQHTNPSNRDISEFSMLDDVKNVTVGEGGVLCLAQDLLPLKEKHKIIPLWAI